MRGAGARRAGLLRGMAALGALALAGVGALAAQETGVSSSAVRISSRGASLELERADGGRLEIELSGGEVRVDGEARGAYEPGGGLERSWRELLSRSALLDAVELGPMLGDWTPAGGGVEERASAAALRAALAAFLAPPPPVPAASGEPEEAVTAPDGSQVTIAPGRLSFQELSERLQRLEASLARLGREAEATAGNLALVVHDDYALGAGRTVPGHLALVGGVLDLQGVVEGDVLVLEGTLVLEPGGRIAGDVLRVGGEVSERGGRVEGEIVSVTLLGPAAAPAAPGPPPEARARAPDRGPGFFGRAGRNLGRATGDLTRTIGFFVVLAVAGILTVYLARPRLEVVADTLRGNFVRAFGVGLAGSLLVVPVALVLVVAIVTILLIPFYVVAVGLAVLVGYLAAAHALGETVALQRYPWFERLRLRRSNSYYYTLSGLAFLLAPFAIAALLQLFGDLLGFVRVLTLVAAVLGTIAACLAGLGAVILTRGGGRSEYASPATPAGGETYAAEGPGGGGARHA